jgi:predicted small integral membrane protein
MAVLHDEQGNIFPNPIKALLLLEDWMVARGVRGWEGGMPSGLRRVAFLKIACTRADRVCIPTFSSCSRACRVYD